ncbi:MAG: hypothetical protein AAF270_10665 [Pseudomonadota bacterium]
MNNILSIVYDAISDAEARGASSVGIVELKNYLATLDEQIGDTPSGDISTADLEKYKARLSKWIEDNKTQSQWGIELFRSTIAAGQSALRAAILINGGAAVALLAFIGNLWGLESDTAAALASPMRILLIGVLVAACASGSTYLAQFFFADHFKRAHGIGTAFNILAMVLVISSYGCFLFGVLSAARVFET